MKRVRTGIWGLSEVAQRVVMPLFQGSEMLAPPDLGSRWSQRPGAVLDYQPAAIATLVAMGDSDKTRLERVAQICNAQTPYGNWRDMLREGELDALLLVKSPEESLSEVFAEMARRGARWLWLNFPPASSAEAILALFAQAQAHHIQVWWAQPACLLRAHRSAWQLMAHGNLGNVETVSLIWPAPFALPSTKNSHWWETAQAFHLALKMAAVREASQMTRILQVMAGKNGDNVSVWAKCANDVTLHLRFGVATPELPRLEICLSEGRSLVCEAGRKLTQFAPRSEAITHDSSGWTPGDSGTLYGAYAEDLKRFLANCGELEPPTMHTHLDEEYHQWRAAAYALQAMEGTGRSLNTRSLEMLPPLHQENLSPRIKEQISPLKNSSATLPLE
jgi:predicted dehydrogenase